MLIYFDKRLSYINAARSKRTMLLCRRSVGLTLLFMFKAAAQKAVPATLLLSSRHNTPKKRVDNAYEFYASNSKPIISLFLVPHHFKGRSSRGILQIHPAKL